MNSLVFVVVLVAGACMADVSHILGKQGAHVHHPEEHSGIVKDHRDILPDGSFQHQYETENGISADAQGNADVVQGSFRWTSPEGIPVEISYLADANGYQPQGSAIPTPPPVPQSVLRALEYIAAHPHKEELARKY